MNEPKTTKPSSPAYKPTKQPFISTTTPAEPEPFFTAKAQQKTDGDTTHVAESSLETEPRKTDADTLSPIRTEVFKLFDLLNRKGVLSKPGSKGSEDADWFSVTEYSQSNWND